MVQAYSRVQFYTKNRLQAKSTGTDKVILDLSLKMAFCSKGSKKDIN